MKKFLAAILCAALCGAMALGAAACGGGTDKLTVYAPDGAPALALANLLAGEEQKESGFDVHIVDSNNIQTYVTGGSPAADLCILPVNAAAKLLGTGETYQMLGTVTNGNLYFLKDASKNLPDLTADNIADVLPGKLLGVIQYENVPGLTLRAVLKNYNVDWKVAETGGEYATDKVNVVSVNPAMVAPATGYDYYLCPEPAATTKIGATQGKLALAGSLQTLYSEGGYPQAVLVAKKSIIDNKLQSVQEVLTYMEGAENYLKTAEAAKLSALLAAKREEGLSAAFSEAQLNGSVLANCSVRFTKAADCKEKVKTFLTQLIAVKEDATAIPADAFFCAG